MARIVTVISKRDLQATRTTSAGELILKNSSSFLPPRKPSAERGHYR